MALTQVSTGGVKDDAITKTKIPANQIEASELADNAVDTNAIANNAVTAGKLASGITDLSNDTSPQLGGTLDLNGNQINGGDSNGTSTNMIMLGASNDLQIFHNGTDSLITDTGTGSLALGGSAVFIQNAAHSANMASFVAGAEASLFHNGSKKLFTTSSGITAGNPDTSQTNVVGAQVGFFAGAKSEFASATGLIQNQVSILDTATSAAAGTGGALTFGGYITSTSSTFYATIEGIKENSTSNNYAGKLKFLTRAHNTSNMNQAMVIDSSGQVGIGTTSPSYRLDVPVSGAVAARFQQTTNNQGEDHACIILRHAAATSSAQGVGMLFQNTGGSTVGSIKFGASTSYNTSSDYRLKENVTAISDGITRLKTLKPSRFNFIADAETTVDGFLAHEVTAVPEAITGTKDEVDSDNNPVYQGIDQSKLVPLLTAALQEAIAKIETLETKVAALEAA